MQQQQLADLATTTPTPLQELESPEFAAAQVRVLLKRDDLVHPGIPGNKFRKLKYNLLAARGQGYDTLLTFGGAFSNHIYATASAGRLVGLRTIGIIRGEEHLPLNPVLAHAVECGMELHYLDRARYRQKDNGHVVSELRRRFGEFYLLPEGGSNELGIRGCAEIVDEIDEDFDAIICACGTGGTLAGLIAGLDGTRLAIGVAVLKGAEFLNAEVSKLLASAATDDPGNWRIDLSHHFGGFARVRPELVDFIKAFDQRHGIVLDPIYTGKMMFGLQQLIEAETFRPGTTVVALHTGGAPASHWAGLMHRKGP